MLDASNGYEAAAARFMARRSRIGADEVRAWARSLRRHARVLDIGCGHGVPITEILLAAGCRVHALDAAPSLVAAFRERFADVPVVCEAAESSPFPGATTAATVESSSTVPLLFTVRVRDGSCRAPETRFGR